MGKICGFTLKRTIVSGHTETKKKLHMNVILIFSSV